MKTYVVEIVGEIIHTLRLEAESVEDARDAVWQRIEDGESPSDLGETQEAYVERIQARELHDWERS